MLELESIRDSLFWLADRAVATSKQEGASSPFTDILARSLASSMRDASFYSSLIVSLDTMESICDMAVATITVFFFL